MGKGFEKLAEWSVKLAERAVRLLDKIIQKITTLAVEGVSGITPIAKTIEWAVNGFEKFPYWEDVEEILGWFTEVKSIHQAIADLSSALQRYVHAYQSVFDAVRSVLEINSNQDVLQITKTMTQGKDEIESQKEQMGQKKGQLEGR